MKHTIDIPAGADRIDIENGVWSFVQELISLDYNDWAELFESDSIDCLEDMTYQQAKAKYEAWKAKRSRIQIGNGVIDENGDHYIVTQIYGTHCDGICEQGYTIEDKPLSELTKTGEHFPQLIDWLRQAR